MLKTTADSPIKGTDCVGMGSKLAYIKLFYKLTHQVFLLLLLSAYTFDMIQAVYPKWDVLNTHLHVPWRHSCCYASLFNKKIQTSQFL